MAENHVETIKNTEKDVRYRVVRDKQNEERQRKLEEIKAQALATQRCKEQREHERRQRLDDLKGRDDVRRQQVEERKRAIVQAEQDRLFSIVKRHQERDARIEAKRRNERSNIVFAFGSSTPRMLDPTDATPSFWGHRRATSIQNISTVPTVTNNSLTRRQSERDIDGSKKRATSASGLDRAEESGVPPVAAGCISGYVGRRRTDLMPTIPSKDPSSTSSAFGSSRKSLNHSPGRAYSMTRLDQLAKPRKLLRPVEEINRPLSVNRQSSVTRSMSHLASSPPAKLAAAHTKRALTKENSRSMHQLLVDGPAIAPRTTRAQQLRHQKLNTGSSSNHTDASSRPSSSLSQQSTTSVTSSVSVRHRPNPPRRQRPISIAVTGVTSEQKAAPAIASKPKPPLPRRQKAAKTPKSLQSPETTTPPVVNITEDQVKVLTSTLIQNESSGEPQTTPQLQANAQPEPPQLQEPLTPQLQPQQLQELQQQLEPQVQQPQSQIQQPESQLQQPEAASTEAKDEMTTSMSKIRISTEEEAKAALAERRRIAREEAERAAELERIRIEEEQRAELERQRVEEEQVQRLIEQQRIAEQERLEEAIKETQKREEEERLRREEEQKSKLLKEEADRKAKEEAERKFVEQQERLKNEEKEREMRRKRVEAIMRRTRGMNNSNNSSQQESEDKSENKSENKFNGTKTIEQQENGTTKNGKDVDIVNNIIPDEMVKNANTLTIDTTTISTDSINSNNTWQTTQQYGNNQLQKNNNQV